MLNKPWKDSEKCYNLKNIKNKKMDDNNTMNNNNAAVPTNDSQNETDEKSMEELEKEMQTALDDIVQTRKEYEKKVVPILEAVEKEPEIPENDSENDVEIAQLEKEVGEELDTAMIDLATKEEDEDQEEKI